MQLLPPGVRTWFVYETDYLSRQVDPNKIMPPSQNDQDPFFAPEAKNVFDLLGVWLPESELKVFQTTRVPKELREKLERVRNGTREFLFFIHPESMDLYRDLLNKGYQQENFRAVATASSRSLLAWKPGHEAQPFIAKVSLNKTIGHSNRAIKGTETAMSVGVSATLEGTRDLPRNVLYMQEPLAMIPHGMERGGMIVRSLPHEFL